MTRQQAGVSAEAVAKIVAKWRNEQADYWGIPAVKLCADELEAALRQEGQAGVSTVPYGKPTLTFGDGEYSCASCGLGMREPCQHWRGFLEAALATAPPEQGGVTTVWIVTQNGRVHSVHASRESAEKEQGENLRVDTAPWAVLQDGKRLVYPQAASGGALDDSFAQIVKELREAQQISGAVGPIEKRVKEAFNWIADRIERLLEATPIIHGQAELAAHDQKVRAEVLESLEKLRRSWDDLADGTSHSFDFRCGLQQCEAELGLFLKGFEPASAASKPAQRAERKEPM